MLLKRQSSTKTLIVLVLVLMMLSSVLSGCGNEKESNESTTASPQSSATTTKTADDKPSSWISDTPISMTMMIEDHANYPYNQNWPTLKMVEEMTNVQVEYMPVPTSDFENKAKVVIATGEIPDVIAKFSINQAEVFGLGGSLLPVSDYLDKLPNLKKTLEDWDYDVEIDNLTQLDGKYYLYPRLDEEPYQSTCFMIRKDLLVKYNIAIPETLEDLYKAMKTIKEQNPEMLGYSNKYQYGMLFSRLGPLFGTRGGWDCETGFQYNEDEANWELAATSDEFREFLVYMRKLMAEGLMDPEIFTEQSKDVEQKMVTGKLIVAVDYSSNVPKYENAAKENGIEGFDLEIILPPAGPATRAVNPTSRIDFGAVSPMTIKNDPDFDKKMKYIDWFFYSDEASTLFTWGIEGQSYQVVNGKKQFMDSVYTESNGIKALDNIKLQNDFAANTNCFTYKKTLDWRMATIPESDAAYYEELVAKDLLMPADPKIKLTSDEKEEETIMNANLSTYTQEMQLKFIFGEASIENDWDAFIKECDSKGRAKLTELYNNAWKRQNK